MPPLTRSRTHERLDGVAAAPELDARQAELVAPAPVATASPAREALQRIQQVYLENPRDDMPATMPSTCTSPGAARLERRKHFRELERGPCRESQAVDSASQGSGMWDAVGDDVVLHIMHLIVRIDSRTERGIDLNRAVNSSARALRSLLLACRRFPAVLAGPGVVLQKEMAARAGTQIAPPLDDRVAYPFSQQMRRELRSQTQLRRLQTAISQMAVHCAGPCCARARNEFNRERANGGARLAVAARRSAVISACPSGDRCFVASRWRQERSSKRERPRSPLLANGRTASEWILCVDRATCAELHALQLTDLVEYSSPHTMRACQFGTSVAFVRNVHSVLGADEPYSAVMVWDTRALPARPSEAVQPPDLAVDHGAINAQDAWWLDDSESDSVKQLVVLWSTAYVHPMGSVVGASADNACYFIALYMPDLSEVQVYVGPFRGKAQTASPDRSGQSVAVLVRKSPVGNGPASLATRCTMMHDIFEEQAVELTHANAISVSAGRGSSSVAIPPHPHDLSNCPSAVALSPQGDCVVAIHRRFLTVLVEVLIRTTPGVFVSVQTIDITHWASLGRGEPTVFDQAEDGWIANALKLPYTVDFSPCGRFAAVVDQRPLFGLSITNYSLVVLDMALRHERRGIRALPMAPLEDIAPRSLVWTEGGLWMQPKYGCLLLSA